MVSLTARLRSQLESNIIKAREAAEAGAESALKALAVHHHDHYPTMTPEERMHRNCLRAHGRQLGDVRDPSKGTQEIGNLVRQCAYEHWHRMLFARFLAENDLLIEPTSGVSVSIDECGELAQERGDDLWVMASIFAQRMLPQIFRTDDPALTISLPPEKCQDLERLLEALPAELFSVDDALGWTYQFWQSAEKKRVNDSGKKITGSTLPAVTQLFTENYMVLFLLHNSLGAWYAGKRLQIEPEISVNASDEDALRSALELPGYTFDYLRFVRENEDGAWKPASGSYDDWPRQARELKVMDPCCGSGHFLVASFDLLVRLRMMEESLSVENAIQAVLSENLYGLELDARCTQIAAFNLALAAWKMAGRVIPLPALNIACSGLSVGVPKKDWLKLAGNDEALRIGMDQLFTLFEQAPELGSLIDPRKSIGEGNMIAAGFSELQPLLTQALHRDDEDSSDDQRELGVAAQGIAKAAELLADRYHLVITNVPFLVRSKQCEKLRVFSEKNYLEAKNDLATVFTQRCIQLCILGGSTAMVLPQNWLFQPSYLAFRKMLLGSSTCHMIAWLGAGAFETVSGEIVKPILFNASTSLQVNCQNTIKRINATNSKGVKAKGKHLSKGEICSAHQNSFIVAPGSIISFEDFTATSILGDYALCIEGLSTGDGVRYNRKFWEMPYLLSDWEYFIQNASIDSFYTARSEVVYWQNGNGSLHNDSSAHNFPMKSIGDIQVLGNMGIRIAQINSHCTLYCGEIFGKTAGTLIPKKKSYLESIWCFCTSADFKKAIKVQTPSLYKTVGSFLQVPFCPDDWIVAARHMLSHGLPQPFTNDPTQWIFHGHPCGSVVWNEQAKRTAHGSLSNDASVLNVAVARLLGYRWPAEHDANMELAPQMHEWVEKCDGLLEFANDDGVVPINTLRGEAPAADRLRDLLAAAYDDEWTPMVERRLLQAAGGDRQASSLEEWLRDKFFEEHCKLFYHRPFIWHIWDGRKDGFSVLVNYHRLAGVDGRRVLENITYTLLGDWIEHQRTEQREGSEGRLLAAQFLQNQLIMIIEGEPPYDIFVRWKPLSRQPVGWTPDLNDGVRVNIRPFLLATLNTGGKTGILRYRPNIKWEKDRGTELRGSRPKEHYPWFWQCEPESNIEHRIDFEGGKDFDGIRWNNLHYSNNFKQTARERAKETGA